jgi:hypothetical protein
MNRSGAVKILSEEKKHNYSNHRGAAVNIKQTEEGIVSVETDKYAFHKRRIDVSKRESGKYLKCNRKYLQYFIVFYDSLFVNK